MSRQSPMPRSLRANADLLARLTHGSRRRLLLQRGWQYEKGRCTVSRRACAPRHSDRPGLRRGSPGRRPWRPRGQRISRTPRIPGPQHHTGWPSRAARHFPVVTLRVAALRIAAPGYAIASRVPHGFVRQPFFGWGPGGGWVDPDEVVVTPQFAYSDPVPSEAPVPDPKFVSAPTPSASSPPGSHTVIVQRGSQIEVQSFPAAR